FVGAAESPDTVGEVNGAVGLHDDVVRTAESLAVIAIREKSSRSVFFETINSAVGHRGHYESALRIQCEAIRSDQQNGDRPGDRLRPDTRVIGSRETALLEINR